MLPAVYLTDAEMLQVAIDEARRGLAEGGLPIGSAMFAPDGTLVSRGHNRLIQSGDPSAHAEVDAFRSAGRRGHFGDLTLATTLSPCWFCSGMVRQFRIPRVIIGDNSTFNSETTAWLAALGVDTVVMETPACIDLLGAYLLDHPEVGREDGGFGRRHGATLGPVRPD